MTKISSGYNKVMVTVEGGRNFVADAAIITVPLGILKANLIEFEPKLPDWKVSAISDLGVGNENKVALRFDKVFWPNVELLGVVAPSSYACGYFLNLHKATGHPILVYMAAGRFAYDLEKLSDESAANFVMLQLKKMFPDACEPVSSLPHTAHFFAFSCVYIQLQELDFLFCCIVCCRFSILCPVGEQIQTLLVVTRMIWLENHLMCMTSFVHP